MVVEMSYLPKEKRKIKTLANGEAFRWKSEWYIKIGLNDDQISNFGTFCEEHLLDNMPRPYDYSQCVAVLHLTSQHFCYANGEVEADDWCPLVATLKG